MAMFWMVVRTLALLGLISGAAVAKDDEPVAAAASKAQYYSESGVVQCPAGNNCFIAFSRVSDNKTLTVRHASCQFNHQRPLDAIALTRGSKKLNPDLGGVAFEKPAAGGANGNYLTGLNQDIAYRVKGGLLPIIVTISSTEGLVTASCVLIGDLG